MPVISLSGRPVSDPVAFIRPEALSAPLPEAAAVALDLDATVDVAALSPYLSRVALIRVAFPGFADGRGFSLARRLRAMGYRGRIRAHGPLIPDQRAALEGCGFDEVELAAVVLDRQGGAAAWSARPARSPFDRRRQRPASSRATAA